MCTRRRVLFREMCGITSHGGVSLIPLSRQECLVLDVCTN